ncbi:MAG: SURF1 family protein [Anaerolineae bacterium]|nr:SURF1 family protein [Anaerolineae bacterium]MCB9131107.1 SURF1 family protein [Anaerolineales bacterium]MCB0227855.1 SURF1 family protein [Anaerolineae bacterium]MCB0233408.1 SURF1 family protein [Anaerolineae bacterium]MCB0237695.1 SURF1 family protein [Anaerolineae bacterium]
MVRTLFSRRYIAMTLLVLLAMAVMVRLGIWQLDRREQRLAHNADIVAKLNEAPLSLNDAAAGLVTIPVERDEVRNTRGIATGHFDYEHQLLLVQQIYQDSLGSRLLTPLILDGSDKAILVDRGWIPAEDSTPDRWVQYDTDTGEVSIAGFVQPSQRIGRPAEVDTSQPARVDWYQADLPAIAAQMPYEILPVYLLQSPDPAGNMAPPFREDPEIDLSEGPHLGYAIQWFSFAIVAGVIYLRIVSQRVKKAGAVASEDDESNPVHGIQHV